MDIETLRRCYNKRTYMNPTLEADIIREVPADDSTSLGEKMLLYWLLRELKPSNVIETGTHRGLTTLYMLAALEDNGKGHLHTADPNTQWSQTSNFRKFPALEKRVTYYPEKGSAMIAKLADIDLAFIDGFHEDYEVLREWEQLAPRLSENAVVVFHDCWYGNTDGVNEAIEKLGLRTIWLPTKNAIRVYSKHPAKRTS